MRMTGLATLALLLLGACSAEVARTNRFDPEGTGEQAPGWIEGALFVHGVADQAGHPVHFLDARNSTVDTQLTDAEGRFVSAELSPGVYAVRAEVPPENVPVEVADVRVLPGQPYSLGLLQSLRLPPEGTLTGRVLLDDPALSPANIKVVASRVAADGTTESFEQYTNAAGAYAFVGLYAGTYEVRAERTQFTHDWTEVVLAPEARSTAQARDLTLYPASAVVRFSVPTGSGEVIGAPYTRSADVNVLLLAFGGVNEMRLSEAADFMEAGAEVAFEPHVAQVPVTLSVGEGQKTLHAQFRVVDGQGAERLRTEAYVARVVLDTSAPQIVGFVFAPAARALGATRVVSGDPTSIPVTLQALDARSLVAGVKLVLGGADPAGVPYTDVTASTQTVDLSTTVDVSAGPATKTLGVQLIDSAGNESALVTQSVVIDNSAPTGNSVTVVGTVADNLPSNALTGTPLVSLVLTSSDPYEMLVANNSGFVGAVWESYNAGPFAWVLSPGDSPSKTVYVKLRDAAGNETAAITGSIALDTTPPSAPVVVAAAGAVYTNAPAPTHTIPVTVGANDAAQMRLSADGVFDAEPWQTFSVGTSVGLPTGDGIKTVYAVFRDAAGNETAAVFDTVELDTTPPASASVRINGDAPFTRSLSVTLELLAGGAAEMQIASDGVLSGEPWVPYSGSAIVLLPAGDCVALGCKSVAVSFRDAAGNELASPVSDSITFDGSAPTTPLITTQPATVNASSVCVSSVGSADTFFDRYEVAGGPTSYPAGFVSVTPSGCGAGVSFTVLLDQGTGAFTSARFENAVRLRAVDQAGNVSAESLVVITEDSVAPVAPVLATTTQFVDADAFSVYLAAASTAHLDATFHHYELRGGQFVSFTPTGQLDGLTFNLNQGDGVACGGSDSCANTLEVRAVDAAGNPGPEATVTIHEDSLPPPAPELYPESDRVSAATVDVLFVLPSPADPGVEANFDHFQIKGGPLTDYVSVCPQATALCQAPLGQVGEAARFVYYDANRDQVVGADEIVGVRFALERDRVNELSVRAVDRAGNVGSQNTVVIEEQSTTRLTDSPGSREYPAVHGDRVAFGETGASLEHRLVITRRGEDGLFTPGAAELVVGPLSGSWQAVRPDVHRDQVLWHDVVIGQPRVFVRHAGTDRHFGTSDDGPPAACGGACDAAVNVQLTAVNSDQARLFGNRVVYRDQANNGDIVMVEPGACGYLCPAATGLNVSTAITSGASADHDPALYGDTLVFLRDDGPACDLWVVQAGADRAFNTGDDHVQKIQDAVDCYPAPEVYAPLAAATPDASVIAYMRSSWIYVVHPGTNLLFESGDAETALNIRAWTFAVHGLWLVAGGNTDGILHQLHAGDDATLGTADDVLTQSPGSYSTNRQPAVYNDTLVYRSDALGYDSVILKDLSQRRWLWAAGGFSDELMPTISGDKVAFVANFGAATSLLDVGTGRLVRSADNVVPLTLQRYLSLSSERLAGSNGHELWVWEAGADGTLGTADDTSVLANGAGTIYLAFQAPLSLRSSGSSINLGTALVTWYDDANQVHVGSPGADGVWGTGGDDCEAVVATVFSNPHMRVGGLRSLWHDSGGIYVRELGAGGPCSTGDDVITNVTAPLGLGGSSVEADLEGGRLVFRQVAGSLQSLYLLEAGADGLFSATADNRLTPLTHGTWGMEDVTISGNWVAWIDYRSFASEIYLLHIPDGGEQNITRRPAERGWLDMWQGRVVWADDYFSTQDIWLYQP